MRREKKAEHYAKTRVKTVSALIIIFAIIIFFFLLLSLERPKIERVGEATVITSGQPIPDNIFNISKTWDLKIHGEMDAINERFGSAVARGDLNNDGIDDLIIGAQSETPPFRGRAGKVYVLYGPININRTYSFLSGLNYTNGINITDFPPNITFYGANGVDSAGTSLATGDLNNDGYDDLVVGGFEATFGAPQSLGGVWVMYGPFPNGSNLIIDLKNAHRVYKGQRLGDKLGTGVAVGDFNDDGFNDLASGAFQADFNFSNNDQVGKVYVEFGPLPNDNGTVYFVNDTADITYFGKHYGNVLGEGLGKGDLNNDGVDDLLMASPSASPKCSNNKIGAGEVYIVYGPLSTSGIGIRMQAAGMVVALPIGGLLINISTVINITVEGVCNEVQGGHAGDAVDAADMNRDSYEDLIVSVPRDVQYGRVYVAYGPFVNGNGIIYNLTDIYDYGYHGLHHAGQNEEFGSGVAGGDFDNDGINNLVIGAPAGAYFNINPYFAGGVGFVYMVNEVGDIIGPNVTLIKPNDGSTLKDSSTVEIIFNASDKLSGILNCSLYTNETGSFEAVLTLNQSEINEGENTTLFRTMSNGNYVWNIQCYDNSTNHNNNFAQTNYTLTLSVDDKAPILELQRPLNNSVTFNASVEFMFNVTDENSGILNCSLYTNETGEFAESNYISGNEIVEGQNTTITKTLAVGDYLWNIICYDDSIKRNYNFAAANFTFILAKEDATGPIVELQAPSTNQISKNNSIEFVFNTTDEDSGIFNCSLFTNESGNFESAQTITGVIEGQNTTITRTLSNGDYLWNVECFDDSINKNSKSAVTNYTLKVEVVEELEDSKGPMITLDGPPNGFIVTDNADVQFVFNVNDLSSDVLNCMLYTNETGALEAVQTITGITEEQNTIITRTLQNGDYTWNVFCYDDSVNQNGAFAPQNSTLTVGIQVSGPPPSGSGSGGGGGGARGARPPLAEIVPIPIPVQHPEQIALRIERPEIVYTPLTVPEEFKETDISCLFVEKKTSQQKLSAKRISLDERLVPEEYEPIINPFRINCANDDLDLTLNLPDNFNNLKVLRCKNGECKELERQESKEELICGGDEIRELRKKQIESAVEYILPNEILEFTEQEKTIETFENAVSSNGYSVEFNQKILRGLKIIIHPPRISIQQPNNPSLSIIGTPLIISLNTRLEEPLPARITIPYPSLYNYDIESLAIYYYNSTSWEYVGGKVNTTSKTVVADVKNIFDYLDSNNEAVFAVGGIKCIACQVSQLRKVYDPGVRRAVILVHGFVSSSETWQPFIDDIVLNKQPWQVWTFSYPFSKSINELADEFSEALEISSGHYDELYIVAHSLGAFIVQDALQKAKNDGLSYTKKVRKVILVGSPNDGTPSIGIYENLFRFLINEKSPYSLFNVKSSILRELSRGKQVPIVQGIDYYVIAGTMSYEFNLGLFKISTEKLLEFIMPNDGVTTTLGAQHIGNIYINNSCKDYFEINLTHTELIDHPISRRVIERIITHETAEVEKDKAIIGYNQYLRVKVKDCSSEDHYIVVGKRISESQTIAPLNCACSNGVCGEGEDEINCPIDCVSTIDPQQNICLIAPILIYILLSITLLVTSLNLGINALRKDRKLARLILRIVTYLLLTITLSLTIYHYLKCGTPLYTAYLIMTFIAALNILDLLIKRKQPELTYPRLAGQKEEL